MSRSREYPPMTMAHNVSTLQKRNSIHTVAPHQYRTSIAPPLPMAEIRDAKSLQDITAHHAKDIISLNVGGKRYSTFFETIARCKSAHFNHFIRIDETSGKVLLYHRNVVEDPQKEVFVNRDGDLFAYVLQYLRDGKKMIIPEDTFLLRQLVREAEFFGLEDFRRMLLEALRFEEKRRDENDDTLQALRNTVNQISQSLYFNGFKR